MTSFTTYDQTINLAAGDYEFTYPRTITEKYNKDISGDAVLVSLGTFYAPATGTEWIAPDRVTSTMSSFTVQMMIGGDQGQTVDDGSYWLWIKLSDNPEIVVRRTDGEIRVKTS